MKVLIKSPSNGRDLLQSLPFIYRLKSEIPDAEVYCVINERLSALVDYIKLPTPIFLLPDRWDNFLGVHKFSVNENNLFNIQEYYDLEGSFHSAYMGWCFKAKRRYGIKKGLNTPFYHNRLEIPGDMAREQAFLQLLAETRGIDIGDFTLPEQGTVSNIVPLFANQVPEDYVLLAIRLDTEEEVQFWQSLLNQFEDLKFIILELSGALSMDRFYDGLDRHNSYLFEKEPEVQRTLNLTARTKAVLTNDQDFAWAIAGNSRQVLCLTDELPYDIAAFTAKPTVWKKEQGIDSILSHLNL